MLRNESAVHDISVPLGDWLIKNEQISTLIWNREWTEMLHRGDKKELEQYLSSFCFSVLDLSEKDQVFVVRTIFVSIITDLLRLQSKKELLRPKMLTKAYEKIRDIESWENISRFILNIPSLLTLLVDELLEKSPFYNECPRVDEAMRLINEHLKSRYLTVKWLADQLDISTTHLSNLFRLKVGTNISNYIAKRRVSEIAYDLVHTTQPLADIREKYGFISHSHFIQFFKKHKGKTPLQYRQYVLNMAHHG